MSRFALNSGVVGPLRMGKVVGKEGREHTGWIHITIVQRADGWSPVSSSGGG